MKTILRFNFYRSLLAIAAVLGCGSAFGQASLPINRTDWGSEPAGWTNSGCSHRTSSSACSNSSSTTFDTNGDSRVVFFNAAPLNLKMTLKNQSMSGSSELVVEQSANGTSYTVLGRYGTKAGATAITNAICTDFTVSLSAATRYVRWTYTKASGNIDMDDVVITAGVVNTPSIVLSPASISSFGDINVGASSGAKFVQVSGTNLTQNVAVASGDASFEVSLDQVAWGSSLDLAPVSGTLSNKTVFIRFSPTAVGLESAVVSFSSAGATTRNLNVSGTGIANTPVITPSTLSLPSFGNVEIGSHSGSASFTFDGIFLTEEVSVVASAGFEVSVDNTAWFSGTDVSPVSGTISNSQIWVRFSPTAGGNVAGNITLSSAGAISKIISLSGNATVPPAIVMDAAGFGPFCNSESAVFEVAFTASGTFAGTVFSAQLSDASGVFTDTATNIVGTGTASPISISIPAGTAAGNYRIRVLNENPLIFSNNNGSDIVINAASVGGNLIGSASYCGTSNSGTLTLEGNIGAVSKWQSSASQDFSTAITDIANTALTLDFSNLSETTYFRAVVANQTCSAANSSIATITINQITVPDFAQIPAFCSGSTAPVLALVSPNGIAGTWNPATISNTQGGNYVFTPDAGQCASTVTLATTVTPLTVPDFATAVTFCSGSVAPVLALASPNGITGTWNPATISNTQNGNYVFTPDAGQCASTVTLATTITPLTVPDFAQIPAFCSGSVAPVLPLVSPNGIAGTWNPATISNTQGGNYVFTPNAGQCASTVTLTTTITPLTVPDFAQIPAFCAESTAPVLALASPNGIAGTWNPATISNTQNGNYVFTPNAGQCASTVTLATTVTPLTVPDFAQIPAFCSGSAAPVLALVSPNGITGTWNPATISNTQGGNYVFTPNAGQCASVVTLTTDVNTVLPPTGTATQDFTTGQTLQDFIVVGQNIRWYDAASGGSELQISSVISSGTVYYASQTVNGCESPMRLPITAGIDLGTDSFNAAKLKYYPNPVDQILNLEYVQAISSVSIYNLLGQQVLIENTNNTAVKIDMSGLNPGTYFVNINSENNSKTVKVIKK